MKIKKILFIAPATEFGAYPPSGSMNIASFLRENNYEVGIIDYSGKKITKEQVIKDIDKENPDIVALGVLTGPGISRAVLVSDVAKSLEKYVVWGGPHVTILPKQSLNHPSINAVILGEGEYALLDLIHFLEGKLKEPLGTYVKINNKIKAFPPQNKFIDLNNKVMPAWDLLKDINQYFPYKKHNYVLIEASRGCAYKCSFCHHANTDVKSYGGAYRNMPAEKVIEEYHYIKSLTSKHIDRMDIGGDLHLATPTYTKKFCEDMIELNEDVTWHSVSKFHLFNVELAKKITQAGCNSIMFGVESGSPRLQTLIGKKVDVNKARAITKTLRKKGALITNTYMMGHPYETLEELNLTKKFMNAIPSDQNLMQIYRPFPGTPYYDLCVKDNLIKKAPDNLKDWESFGVLLHHTNVSNIPDSKLMKEFYKINMYEQMKFLINSQRFFLRNKMYQQFIDGFANNRFTFKLKELLRVKTG